MDKKIITMVSFYLLICSLGNAQNIKRAERSFDDYSYIDAITSFEDLVKMGYSNKEILQKLGDSYYNNAEYKEAGEWYEKLLALPNNDSKSEYLYRYAMCLKSIGDYDKSNQWMQLFKDKEPADTRALNFEKNMDYLVQIEEYSNRYTVQNLSINSKESDFAPTVYKEQLVFSSARESGFFSRILHLWNNKPFHKLFRASIAESLSFSKLSGFSKELDTKAHESSTAFSADGNTLYFTRNNFKKGRFSKDNLGISRLKIYRAVLENGKWKHVTELPFNSDNYSVAHPSLSADGKRLYFASDMPGSIGSSDIFYVNIHSDGSFGEPINMGPNINTEGRETFPFVTASNLLYFASDGHLGLGGLDIFATQLEDEKNNCVVNIGAPINSKADDFALALDGTGKNGYFTSNREGGMGSDDIYYFTEEKPLKIKCFDIINGALQDLEDGQPLADFQIKVYNHKDEIVVEGITDKSGTFRLEPTYKPGDYKVVVNKEGYVNYEAPFVMSKNKNIHKMEVSVKPEMAPMAVVGTNLGNYLNLSPVLFDFDKWAIKEDAKLNLDKIVTYMKLYPNLKLEIRSHTDTRGSKSYNEVLSVKRALETKDYLVSQGISGSRISSIGYGENDLINDCSSQYKCSVVEYRLSRRSEFIVVN
ncbi:MAG: OmpA family protein [Gelidibacter sp.]